MNDPTLDFFARSLALSMLLFHKTSLDEAISKLSKPSAKSRLLKMFACRSEFGGPIPRPVGIDMVNESSAMKMQQSLDHKQVKKGGTSQFDVEFCMIDIPIRPKLKISMLHSDRVFVWIRVYSEKINESMGKIENYTIKKMGENVYELYNEKKLKTLGDVLLTLEIDYQSDIIFCSELSYFLYNQQLFLSNYIKFMWCYTNNQTIFNPITYKEIESMTKISLRGKVFLESKNQSTMPLDTHNPLIAFTGERPKIALKKFVDRNKDQVYINEGSRAMQCVNKPSDFGTFSNYIEISSNIIPNYASIADII